MSEETLGHMMIRELQEEKATLRARVAELEAKLEESKRPHLCNVCVGKPLASGRQCICGGAGTEAAEMQGLRAECFRLTDEVARLTLRAWETDGHLHQQPAHDPVTPPRSRPWNVDNKEGWWTVSRYRLTRRTKVEADAVANALNALFPTPEPPHA